MQRLSMMLAAALLLGGVAASAQEHRDHAPRAGAPFSDVPKDHWAYDAVEQLRQKGILRGYPPSRPQTRAPAAPRKPARIKRQPRR